MFYALLYTVYLKSVDMTENFTSVTWSLKMDAWLQWVHLVASEVHHDSTAATTVCKVVG